MLVPGKSGRGESADFVLATEDAARLTAELGPLLESAVGVTWYRAGGTEVDRAAWELCRLRRAYAGIKGGIEHGDEAVRAVLSQATPEAVAWIASRAISYMDESGFPEAIEPWLETETRASGPGA